MFLIEFLVVLACILIGARIGGIGLGIMGGFGLAILTFVFGLQPTSPPIDVMLMIMAVVAAAACMQAAGGLDYLVHLAEKLLRKQPRYINFMAPLVTYVFTMLAGTGHVAYSVLPIIAEVSRRTGIRPERPMSVAVIASQFAIVVSPISAATVAMVGVVEPAGITLGDILMVTIPCTFIGLAVAAFAVGYMGADLSNDAEYQRRMQDPEYRTLIEGTAEANASEYVPTKDAKFSVGMFLLGSLLVVILGAIPSLRPVFEIGGNEVRLGMAHAIEIVMLTVASITVLVCKPNQDKVSRGSVFHAGMRAIIAIFGIAWLGDTLFNGHMGMLKEAVQGLVETAPWAFAFALFGFSVMVNSQGATTAVLMPLGLALGIEPAYLVAMFVAVNGYFFIPNYGPIIAAIDFDVTGTTKIGKYIFNHSFMMPGMVAMIVSLVFGFVFAGMFL